MATNLNNRIIKIYSSDPKFKEVRFKDGLNIILAEVTDKSTDKDSRNGVGKSLLMDIIHYLFGGSQTGKTLNSKELDKHVFLMDVVLNNYLITVKRAIKDNYVSLDGNLEDIKYLSNELFRNRLSIDEWKKYLCKVLFGFNNEMINENKTASFRTLFTFIARRSYDHGYEDPFKGYLKMTENHKQLSNTFLLGLGVEIAAQYIELIDKKAYINNLKKVISSEIYRNKQNTSGKLKTEIAILEDELRSSSETINKFRVVDKYSYIEDEVNRLTIEMHKLENKKLSRKTTIEFYKKCLLEEGDPGYDHLLSVYENERVYFNELIKKQLQDSIEFHKKLIINRKNFLQNELSKLEADIELLSNSLTEKEKRHIELMNILESGGALEEYLALQDLHAKKVMFLEKLKIDYDRLERMKEENDTLRVKSSSLNRLARIDLKERDQIVDHAITTFNNFSRELYGEEGGKLIIDIKDDKGYTFDIEKPGSGSSGIEAMKIFCYDLMLAHLWSSKPIKPGMLIHDSDIFDPCDERQIASALNLVNEQCEIDNYQYICMLNSDRIPKNDLLKRNIEKNIICKLTDQESGGLLGFKLKNKK